MCQDSDSGYFRVVGLWLFSFFSIFKYIFKVKKKSFNVFLLHSCPLALLYNTSELSQLPLHSDYIDQAPTACQTLC